MSWLLAFTRSITRRGVSCIGLITILLGDRKLRLLLFS
ncbi:hypothetical protein LINPERPRIM_LOCUS40836 [Linum perenne]